MKSFLNLGVIFGMPTFLPQFLAQTGSRNPNDIDPAAGCAACGGCAGVFIFVIITLIVLNIALLIWVARDSKARGMDSSVMWMILVLLTSFVGLIIYFFSRPQGQLIQCSNCKNKRLLASLKCPHCGDTSQQR